MPLRSVALFRTASRAGILPTFLQSLHQDGAAPVALVKCAYEQLRCTSSGSPPATDDTQQIIAACILERLPVVQPDDPDWEVEHMEWQEALDNKYRKKLPASLIEIREEEGGDAEEIDFEPGPLWTEADETNDVKSLDRALERSLFLIMKSSGAKGVWQFPARQNRPGETMRQTAIRALEEHLREDSRRQVFYVGNAPAGHHPAPNGRETVFFHRAQLIKGTVAPAPKCGMADYAWLTKEELSQQLPEAAVGELMLKMLR